MSMQDLRASVRELRTRLFFGDPQTHKFLEFKLFAIVPKDGEERGNVRLICALNWVYGEEEQAAVKAAGYPDMLRQGVQMPHFRLRRVLSWCLARWHEGNLVRYDSNEGNNPRNRHIPRYEDHGRRLVVRLSNPTHDKEGRLVDGNVTMHLTLPGVEPTQPSAPLTINCELKDLLALELACTYVPMLRTVSDVLTDNGPARLYGLAEIIEMVEQDPQSRRTVQALLSFQAAGDGRRLRVAQELIAALETGGQDALDVAEAALAALRPKLPPPADPTASPAFASIADGVRVRQEAREAADAKRAPTVEHKRTAAAQRLFDGAAAEAAAAEAAASVAATPDEPAKS